MPSGTARRAHTKSRGGCTLCKAKKVKCDEKRPCSYCAKKLLRCSLDDEASEATTLSPPSASRPESSTESSRCFAFADFALFRHFIKSTAVAHADDHDCVMIWSEIVADLAAQYPFLLHELLALSALHSRLACPERAESLEQVAAEHQGRAIPLFRDAIVSSRQGDEALALFACSCLIVPYHFAAAKDPLSLLLNEETKSSAEWLVLIEGTAAITNANSPAIMRSALRPLLGKLIPLNLDIISDSAADRELCLLKGRIPVAPEHRDEYVKLIDTLRFNYTISDLAETVIDRKNSALRWPPLMSRQVKEQLGSKESGALILMAFWLVLLHRIEDRWWLKGKVAPIVAKISKLLTPEHRKLITYPMEQVSLGLVVAENPRAAN
ncbi:hypothetical protein F5Y15DRAFT_384360 [Xylariaceae sp. FL0016]|nr:hypothetical protein F5Y15DRAFT_384360 [Xylariaceae sp. FL0016]